MGRPHTHTHTHTALVSQATPSYEKIFFRRRDCQHGTTPISREILSKLLPYLELLKAGCSEHSFWGWGCRGEHARAQKQGDSKILAGNAVGTKMSGRYKQGGRSSDGLSAKHGSAERVQVDDLYWKIAKPPKKSALACRSSISY